MTSVRIAVVTDIHHGEDKFTKKGAQALALMDGFRRFVADAAPDLVLDLGDRISDVDHATDLRLEREVADAFRPIRAPVLHLCGNHDVNCLSVAENEEILGQSLGHRTVDVGAWTIVLWRADTLVRAAGFKLGEDDLLWLAGVVRTATRPLAIASHVPVSGHDQTGNYYFQRNLHLSTYPLADRVRAVLRTARVPVVWISGHVHWNTATIVDGIPHLTVQSLTETFTTHPEPAATCGLLELGDRIEWEAIGRDPFRFGTVAAATLNRPIAPLPSMEEMPEIRSSIEFTRS